MIFKSDGHIVHTCKILLLLVIFLFSIPSIVSAKKNKKTKKSVVIKDTTKIHSPRRALIYSAVLPGLGQAYNKKYWKVPLVYAAIGSSLSVALWNNKYYKKYRDGYIDWVSYLEFKNQEPNSKLPIDRPKNERYRILLDRNFDRFTTTQDNLFHDILKDRRDNFKRDRDLWYIITTGFYILNIIDAVVDAHLLNFDVSEDLSVSIKPSIQQQWNTNDPNLGITIAFTIK